ncbi:MAG TPA: glycosyltransferase [Mycobacteriales bacterium]|nr:glycosyltransferase [Mycobacteriales bacterium]
MTSTPTVTVTVAVVVKDRKESIAYCLDGIERQEGVDFDVVVVDNESTDGTYEYLLERSQHASRTMTILREPGSLGHIRNLALETATGAVVAFTDSDCVPQPGWLRAGVDAFAGDVAVVQGRTVPASQPKHWEATIDISSFSHRYETCNIFYDRAALLGVGGFGKAIAHLGEDVVAGWRLRAAGMGSAWQPDAVVAHDVSYPGVGWWIRRGLRYEFWPGLIREFPDARRELMFARYFLNNRQPRVAVAVLGVASAAGALSPWPLLATAPLIWRWRPEALSRRALDYSIRGLAYELAMFAGLVKGSVRARRLVL